ncbi:MAG: beta-lactamase family protein, partial [Bacteroidales bacterium]|nr:beta-lactamase family protein [Bacteroidales bacterium]
MKKLMPLILIFLFASAYNQTKSIQISPPLSDAFPEDAGMSTERLKRIDHMLEEAIETEQIPGAVALIVRDGKIVYHKAFGMADNETGKKLKKNDIFRIASQSKAITSTAVMMLWEEGKFKLDDPISKYIPEFKDPQVINTFRFSDTSWTTIPAKQEITIRHLLNHTSGLGYGIIDGDERIRMIYHKAGVVDLFTTDSITIGESVKRLAALPLHHHPGDKYTYSEGLDVLGYFIEVVSGMPFDQFLRTRLFDPLGMNDTWFYLPDKKADRLVKVQTRLDGEWAAFTHPSYDVNYPVTGAKTFFS